MSTPEQDSAGDAAAKASGTAARHTAPEPIQFAGYLHDTGNPDEVELRESKGGETGQWLVFHRNDVLKQSPADNSGQTRVWVSPNAEVVFRAKMRASRVYPAAAEMRPTVGLDRWPRIPPRPRHP
jgi:hypothetical protein